MGELEAFYARRRRVTFVICLASALQAILFGSSVLIEGLLTTFDEPGRTYAFHGLYAKVLITPVANLVAAQMMWTFKRRLAPGWIFYGVAAAAGPIVAYCVSQNRVYRGKSEAGAYNPFFYAAAGLSFGNFLLVATMGWLERRAVAKERA